MRSWSCRCLTYVEGYPGILRVFNRGEDNTPTEYWHADSPYLERPPALSILAAKELPTTGSDTMWCDQYLAYDALSVGMKSFFDAKRVKYSGAKMAKRTRRCARIRKPAGRPSSSAMKN